VEHEPRRMWMEAVVA